MQLSKRLEKILEMAGTGSSAADIGTDHGYIPIELVRRGSFERAYAMDVRKGPLERASEHICSAGLQDSIRTRLSDGLQHLAPGEAEVIIIAGMGGPLIERLIQNGWETAVKAEALILSPQSEIGEFHHFLLNGGFRVEREEWIEDEGKYYVVLRTTRSEGPAEYEQSQKSIPWSAAELEYGRQPLKEKSPALKRLLEQKLRTGESVLARLDGIAGESAAVRRGEMENTVRIVKDALEFYRL